MSFYFQVILTMILFLTLDLIILIDLERNTNHSQLNSSFGYFAMCTVIQQLIPIFVYSFDYGLITVSRPLLVAFYILMFTSMTACSYFAFQYLLHMLFNERRKYRFVSFIYPIPLLVMAVTSILSIKTGWIFILNEDLVYSRGTLFLLQPLCPFSYMFIAILISFHEIGAGRIQNIIKSFRYFIVFIIPSIVGILLQFFVFNGGYSQIGISFGFILMYLELYMDELHKTQLLEEKQHYLEQSSEEQEAQIEEITALNKQLDENNKQLQIAYQQTEQAFNTLKEQNSFIKSLSQLYNSLYFIDMTSYSFIEIGTLTAEIRGIVGKDGNAKDAFDLMCSRIVEPEFQQSMKEFCDLTTLNDRLKDRKWMTQQYKAKRFGWVEGCFVAAEKDFDGNLLHVIWATRDVTEQKLKELQQQEELEVARKDAVDANRAKTSFLFNMSHDIRTPMNAIIGYTQLMKTDINNPQKLMHYQQKMEQSSEFLLSLINNVLDMAKIESGTMELDTNYSKSGDIIEGIISVFDGAAKEKNLTFIHKVDIKHDYIYCDITKVREIFSNLISNAVKYTPEGGTISMITKELESGQDDIAIFETVVEDTGVGMSEDYIPHLFENFSREKNTTLGKVAGTGLGMPIVKKLVELMGGTITVESEINKGTKFIVTIPHKIADQDNRIVGKPEVLLEHFEGRRILLAEDNDLNAEIAIAILEDVGFEIDRAEDGQICVEKLEKAESGYYNLILMDIQMPRMSGYDACRVIRAMNNDKANIPILAMTANAFDEDKKEAFDAGMNGHISKPINVKELLEEINGVLNK